MTEFIVSRGLPILNVSAIIFLYEALPPLASQIGGCRDPSQQWTEWSLRGKNLCVVVRIFRISTIYHSQQTVINPRTHFRTPEPDGLPLLVVKVWWRLQSPREPVQTEVAWPSLGILFYSRQWCCCLVNRQHPLETTTLRTGSYVCWALESAGKLAYLPEA